MRDTLPFISIKLKALFNNEEGQDLIEYALVVAPIAFGSVASIDQLSGDIFFAFSEIGSLLTSSLA